VGEDIDTKKRASAARSARAVVTEGIACGHEIANHSYSHHYDLARRPRAIINEEIGRSHELLCELVGKQIAGFRAPGYELSPVMVETLMSLGYQYDTSILPAPAYYAAKALVMGGMAISGRASGAILTDPRAVFAPADPYRLNARKPWRKGCDLVEIPIAVTPLARIPVIGTSVLLAPTRLRTAALIAMARRPIFNFELHGIDLIDANDDGIPGRLVACQPDLRISLAEKLAGLREFFAEVRRRFAITSLAEIARNVA